MSHGKIHESFAATFWRYTLVGKEFEVVLRYAFCNPYPLTRLRSNQLDNPRVRPIGGILEVFFPTGQFVTAETLVGLAEVETELQLTFFMIRKGIARRTINSYHLIEHSLRHVNARAARVLVQGYRIGAC